MPLLLVAKNVELLVKQTCSFRHYAKNPGFEFIKINEKFQIFNLSQVSSFVLSPVVS